MVFRVMSIIRTEPESKWISDRTRNIQNLEKILYQTWSQFLICIQNTLRNIKHWKYLSITWRLVVLLHEGWWLKMAVESWSIYILILFSLNNVSHFMRTWFSFYAFIYLVFFLSVNMCTFRLILNDHGWCSLFLNRFYLSFGYKIGTNHVF